MRAFVFPVGFLFGFLFGGFIWGIFGGFFLEANLRFQVWGRGPLVRPHLFEIFVSVRRFTLILPVLSVSPRLAGFNRNMGPILRVWRDHLSFFTGSGQTATRAILSVANRACECFFTSVHGGLFEAGIVIRDVSLIIRSGVWRNIIIFLLI